MALTNQPRMVGFAISDSIKRARRRVASAVTGLVGFSGFVPERLLIAPQDLRTADPTMALEFYRGRYSFAGVTVETRSASPFPTKSVDAEWERRVHDFKWLRHLSASDDALSESHAKAMVEEWIKHYGKPNRTIPWEIEIASCRLIAWLCHSVVIVTGANHDFYRRFMRSLGVHVRFLRKNVAYADDGMPRLIARIALAYASVCLQTQKSALRQVRNQLDQELAEQVYPDGGHVSRNPEAIAEILALLLPLRQACSSAGMAPSQELVGTIERLLPALRFFRHGDGNLSRFNHNGVTENDLVATLLRYDETLGEPLKEAPQSGYQRLIHGTLTALMDVGNPPKGELSESAHAGCLSFELSDGRDCIIVNCGAPTLPRQFESAVWRTTPAHSTATFNDTSSCRFSSLSVNGQKGVGQIYASALNATSSREDSASASTVVASHLGYMREFGVRHQRALTLSENKLAGEDYFSDANGEWIKPVAQGDIALRFHFHPDITLGAARNGETILVKTREGVIWRFDCEGGEPVIEESIFFASPSGARRTEQIVVHANLSDTPKLIWSLQKTNQT